VEHLVMIGGPNDLLIESRILRGPAAGSGRPNVQQMPRPAPVDTERSASAVSPSLEAPASQVTHDPGILPLAKPFGVRPGEGPDVETRPVPPSPIASSAQTPPPAAPPRAANQPVSATMPPPIEPRRPSLNDLIGAAAAAKAVEPRPDFQPVSAPPPTSPAHPDLEEDDRDGPTQIVPYRPGPTQIQQPLQRPETTALDPHAVRHPPINDPADRETEVATQIERALADLNPLGISSTQPEARTEPALPDQSQMRRPDLGAGSSPQPTAPVIQARTAPIAAPIPTMPPIPPRPSFGTRPSAPERTPPVEAPRVEPAIAQAEPPAAWPAIANDPPPVPTPVRTAVAPEPATAPRPLTTAPPRPVQAPAAQPGVAVPPPAAKQNVDELEEEMAKLLSELGGTSAR
jgi:hypothetical protein